MAPFNPTLALFTSLLLLGLACPTLGELDFANFRSPYDDLPTWSKDWSRYDWQTAIDRSMHERIYNYPRKARFAREAPTPSCASAWAKESAGTESAGAPLAGAGSASSTAGSGTAANQYIDISQRSGPDDYSYYSGPQTYQQQPQTYQQEGSVFQQHPNLPQFQRLQTSSSWMPGGASMNNGRANEQGPTNYDQIHQYANRLIDQFIQNYNPLISRPAGQSQPETGNSFASQRSSAYYIIPSNQYQQYRSSSSGNMHPVETLPDIIEKPSAPKSTSQHNLFIPASSADPNLYTFGYRAAESPQTQPQQSAEDINTIKTTSPQYYNYASDYYKQQIQQALADGKQLVAGIPNSALNQQLAQGTADKLSAGVSPVFTTLPVTTLNFDPEEMRRVYGQYNYVPPVFSLAQRQPNSYDGAPNAVVRDVLQYLLNQYQSNGGIINGINSGNRNQRLLPNIYTQNEKMLHGFAPLQTLPRQTVPQWPSFTGDNQLLPPNMYRGDKKWEPTTNLVVHNPVNLADFEQRGLNQMGQYAARSTPCSKQKRQVGNIWGYYPELTPGGVQMGEMYPGLQSDQSSPDIYGQPGLEGSGMGRTAPGLPGLDNLFRQTMGYGQQVGGYGQPTGGTLGQFGLGQAFGNQAYPDYYSNYQGRDSVPGLQQVISGISQLMPMIPGNGLPQLRR